MEIVKIKCDGCGRMRKWYGYECLTFCDCLADEPEDEDNLLDPQVSVICDKNSTEIKENKENKMEITRKEEPALFNEVEEELKRIAQRLAKLSGMPYAWEDVLYRLYHGYQLPFKFLKERRKNE